MLERELTYFGYYFIVLARQIAPYWVLGILVGSLVSVFGKQRIGSLLADQSRGMGLFGILPASLLGILSPVCMFGTIPVAASLSRKGMRDDWLAAFMMSSILLNPQLVFYSAMLGREVLLIRIVSSILCGIGAGLLVNFFYRRKSFFTFSSFEPKPGRDTDPNPALRLLKNIGRNVKATGLYFLIGMVLTVLFQRYVPSESFGSLFGKNQGFGILVAATLGVPAYVCGGGTIPLLMEWLDRGLSLGAAASFMISGPATKFTNLGAVKVVLGPQRFALYLVYSLVFAVLMGFTINFVK